MTLSIKDQLIQSRLDLLVDYPFYGSLALHLPLVESKAVPTFATDYKKIYYNPEFVERCSREDKRFILCHELSHVVFLHGIRRGDREIERWNLATDFAINAILKKEFNFVPKGGLYNEKFENMTAEKIYNLLPEMKGYDKG